MSVNTDYTSTKTDLQLPENVRALCLLMRASIIPVSMNKKPPKGFAWKPYQSKRPALNALEAWQRKYDPSAWALITGKVSDLIVLDFDGPEGIATYNRWFSHIPLNVATPNGGHIWIRYDQRIGTLPDNSLEAFPGVGVRSDGGYAVFTGSTTNDKVQGGRPLERRIADFTVRELDELPEEFVRLIIAGKRSRQGGARRSNQTSSHTQPVEMAHKWGWNGRYVSANEGVRNSTLTGQACVLLRGGMPVEWVAHNITFLNQHGFEKPLDAQEVDDVLRKAADKYRDAPFKRKPVQYACRIQKAYGLDRSFIPLLAKIYESAYFADRWEMKKAAGVIADDLDIADESWVRKKLRHLAALGLLRKNPCEDQIRIYEVVIDDTIQSELEE